MTNEYETFCDCCEKTVPWEDLATADDGETWICESCQPVGGTTAEKPGEAT